MKTVGIVGHFSFSGAQLNDGQTVKTYETERFLSENPDIKTLRIDTESFGRNIFKIFVACKRALRNCDVVILMASRRGHKILSPLLVILNIIYHKKLIDIVIGGTRYMSYQKHRILLWPAKRFHTIFVETNHIKSRYEDLGLKNVKVLPNYKDIEVVHNTKSLNKNNFKVCTFSRVCLEKGIEDAIAAVKYANQKKGQEIFSLDIYGDPDPGYRERFSTIQKDFPSCVKYMGSRESSIAPKIIAEYDLLLFLTQYTTEGFPGTLIDAMAAGAPVISTHWSPVTDEILDDGKDSFVIGKSDPKKVGQIMLDCYEDYSLIKRMRIECEKKARRYTSKDNIQPLLEEILK